MSANKRLFFMRLLADKFKSQSLFYLFITTFSLRVEVFD